MDAEERALLNAIIAQPEEDTPRLVYADWLQEHDRPERAEYIRLSIELANLRYGDPDFEVRKRELSAKRGPLRRQFMDRWRAEVAAQVPALSAGQFYFQRGFAEEVACSVSYFLANADALFRACPLRLLTPNVPTASMLKRLVNSRHFRRLSAVRCTRPDDALALLTCPSVVIGIVDFDPILQPLPQNRGEWDPVAVAVAAHTGLKAVATIDFALCGLTDEAGRALANSPHLNPERLNLLNNEFSDPVKQVLCARYGPRVWLEEVDRAGTPLGDDD